MLTTWYQFLAALFLVLCLTSFGWAMKGFFAKPAGRTPAMRATAISGAVFSLAHLVFLLWPGAVTPRRAAAGIVLYSCSLALFWWALSTNRRRPLSAVFSPDLPQHLVQEGPYRFIRHPFYASYLLTWLAGAVACRSVWLLATVAVMLVLYVRAARAEESKFARSPLAAAYDSYRSRTGLFIPNPIKLLSGRRPDARVGA